MTDCSLLVKYLEVYLFADSVGILIPSVMCHQEVESRIRGENCLAARDASQGADGPLLRSAGLTPSRFG